MQTQALPAHRHSATNVCRPEALQIHVVAALLGLGIALCWCYVVWELDSHTLRPGRAVALPLGALGCGAIGGVVLPALLLRRREVWPAARVDKLEASGGALCGLLLLPCGIGWGAVVGCAGLLESTRGAIAGAFTFSPGFTLLLLWTPICALLLAAGAALGVACAALHGWKRELGLLRRFQSIIWPVLLVASAGGALLATAGAGQTWPPIAGVAALFAAAVVATLRVTRRAAWPYAAAHAEAGVAAGGGATALCCVVIAGANVAAALASAIRPEREAIGIGGATAALCLASALAFTGPIQRLRGWPLSPVLLCAAAALVWATVEWVSASAGGQRQLVRLVLVVASVMLALLVAARQLAVHLGGTRRGLAACVAFGGFGVLVTAALAPYTSSPAEISFTITLLTAFTCAWLLVTERQTAPSVRAAGLLLTALATGGIILAPRSAANFVAAVAPVPESGDARATANVTGSTVAPSRALAKRIVGLLQVVPSLRPVVAAPAPSAEIESAAAWRTGLMLDLAPQSADIVIVTPPGDCDTLSQESAARLARRWFAGLRAGGRIVVIEAAASTAEAVIWEWKRHRDRTRMEAVRIVWAGEPTTEVLAIGSDVPALLSAALPGDIAMPQIQTVTGYRQFLQLRAAPRGE